MILALWLIAVQPKDPPCYEAVNITAPVSIDPEEIEAESTGGKY